MFKKITIIFLSTVVFTLSPCEIEYKKSGSRTKNTANLGLGIGITASSCYGLYRFAQTPYGTVLKEQASNFLLESKDSIYSFVQQHPRAIAATLTGVSLFALACYKKTGTKEQANSSGSQVANSEDSSKNKPVILEKPTFVISSTLQPLEVFHDSKRTLVITRQTGRLTVSKNSPGGLQEIWSSVQDISTYALNHNGTKIAYVTQDSADKSYYLWFDDITHDDPSKDACIKKINFKSPHYVLDALIWSPDEKQILIERYFPLVINLETENSETLNNASDSDITSMAFTADNKHIVLSNKGRFEYYDRATAKKTHSAGAQELAYSLIFNTDGQKAYIKDGYIHMPRNDRAHFLPQGKDCGDANGIWFTPCGKFILACYRDRYDSSSGSYKVITDKTLKLWDLTSDTIVAKVNYNKNYTCGLTADGLYIYTVVQKEDKTFEVQFYDISSFTQQRLLVGPSGFLARLLRYFKK